MHICYQVINGEEYAKLPGKSVRINGRVRKEGVQYLGRVIDKSNHVFYTKKQGIYVFDPNTGECKPAPETYTSDKLDKRTRQKVGVDFGDVYFIDAILKKMKYNEVIDAIDYKNRDTLYAMIAYYILDNGPNDQAISWYRGSFAKVLYPKANLTSQRISDFLKRLGDGVSRHKFFEAHIEWLKKNICADSAIILDSTGAPNSINFQWSALSNHNGDINREVRLTVPVQRDSGFPILFHVIPGNVVDVTTLSRDILEIQENNFKIDMALFDAGYDSKINFDQLYGAEIDYVSRLSSKFGVYNEIIKKYGGSLRNPENLVEYNGRCLYIIRADCKIASGHDAYAYLGCDLNSYSDQLHKTLKKIASKKKTTDDLNKMIEDAGIFMLISSLPYEPSGILPAYYARQAVEQFFDVAKGSAKLTPLRVHGENAMFGHLLLSMIAATFFLYIQKHQERIYTSSGELFKELQIHKCDIWKTRVIIDTPAAYANELYKKFKIQPPLGYRLQGENGLAPITSIHKAGSNL